MSEILSAAKGVKSLHEVSEVVFIPATTLALWSQFGPDLVAMASGSIIGALILCCGAGLLGSLGFYQFLTFISSRFHTQPVFPTISISLIGVGLIGFFQDHLQVSLAPMTQFTSFALVAWGFMIDRVVDHCVRSENERMANSLSQSVDLNQ